MDVIIPSVISLILLSENPLFTSCRFSFFLLLFKIVYLFQKWTLVEEACKQKQMLHIFLSRCISLSFSLCLSLTPAHTDAQNAC